MNESFTTYTAADLDRIEAETSIRQVEHRREVASTNDLAIEMAQDDRHRLPLLVLTELQSSGRGRRVNRWWSAPGALTFSLLLDATTSQLAPSRWSQVSLTTGLAICEALEETLNTRAFRLKWPNDVYVTTKKVSGVLVESPHVEPARLVLGIGINVNNSLADGLGELSAKATALCDVAYHQIPLVDVLVRVLKTLENRLAWIGVHDAELHDLWRSRCLLTGRQVRIETETERFQGICRGIDDNGALLVQAPERLQRFLSGMVTLSDLPSEGR